MWNTIWQRIWDGTALGIIAAFAGLGLLLGNYIAHARGQSVGNGMLRGLEAMLTAAAGGLLARGFISLVLGLAGDSSASRLAVGWAFFLWPGALDTIPTLDGHPLLSAGAYLGLATLIGAWAGMMDGVHRIHDWKGFGLVTFVADMTWGLAGTTNGCLFHLMNLFLTKHASATTDERQGTHRYLGGFRFKEFFAVTQGAVMSNMLMVNSGTTYDYTPGTPLFTHERTHVLQNRIFGPFFTLTYLAWMGLWLPAGLISGLVSKRFGVMDSIQWSSYFNNPWEVWAYKRGGRRALNRQPADTALPLTRHEFIVFTVCYTVVVLALAGVVVKTGWFA